MIYAVLNLYFDNGLLPYYLRYYKEKGVDRFIVICHNCSFPVLKDYPCEVIDTTEPYVNGKEDSALHNKYIKQFLQPEDWYLPTDVDEFHWQANMHSFQDWVSDEHEWIPSVFIDRMNADGLLPEIDPAKTLDEQFPVQARISERLQCCSHHKCAMARRDVDASTGHHNAHPWKQSAFAVHTHHFKWMRGTLEWMRDRSYSIGTDGLERLMFHWSYNGKFNLGDAFLEGRPSPKIGI